MIFTSKKLVVCDTECYHNYFLAKFYDPELGRIVGVEMFTDPDAHRRGEGPVEDLNRTRIRAILQG